MSSSNPRDGAPGRLIRAKLVALATVAFAMGACGGGDSTEPPAQPAAVVATSANPAPSANVSTALAVAPTFEVRDAKGVALAGVAVTVTITSGGGTLVGAPTVSLAGPTSIGTWTLGATPGDQRVTVAVSGVAPLVFAVDATPVFNVAIRYVGTPPSAAIQQAFTNARQRIGAVIAGDLSDVALQRNAEDLCLPAGSMPPVNETIDDVVIFARIIEIDGPGQVLGSAGPCLIRNSIGLTVTGVMQFDSADLENMVASGRLPAVILHEMLHVIGIGTLWTTLDLLTGEGTADSRFTGALAREACVTLNGGATPCNTAVPAENCLDLPVGQTCGGGTQDSHWKESIFRHEVMTGFAGTGDSPLSAISVQSLADLGYQVNLSQADAYTVPPPAFRALMSPEAQLRLPTPGRPRFKVDDAGRITPIPERR